MTLDWLLFPGRVREGAPVVGRDWEGSVKVFCQSLFSVSGAISFDFTLFLRAGRGSKGWFTTRLTCVVRVVYHEPLTGLVVGRSFSPTGRGEPCVNCKTRVGPKGTTVKDLIYTFTLRRGSPRERDGRTPGPDPHVHTCTRTSVHRLGLARVCALTQVYPWIHTYAGVRVGTCIQTRTHGHVGEEVFRRPDLCSHKKLGAEVDGTGTGSDLLSGGRVSAGPEKSRVVPNRSGFLDLRQGSVVQGSDTRDGG